MRYKQRMPNCKVHHDCFANKDGMCSCLNNNDFNGKDCPFYKTVCKEQNGEQSKNGGLVYED